MKKIKNVLAFIFLVLLFASCSKSSPTQAVLAITSISPDTVAFGTTVTITGTGFNTVAANNTVAFNNVAAIVQSATSTKIVVTVPKGAGSGAVTVQTGSKTSNGYNYTYQYTYTVSTLAGSGTAGFVNGNGTAAQFNSPIAVATDAQGNVYVADAGNNSIRKITADKVVTTLAGSGTAGFADGNSSNAQFNDPSGVATDAQGNVYVGDYANNCIRMITTAGMVSTIAGSTTAGFADGTGTAALFKGPIGVATDVQGNIYVSDGLNSRIRKITSGGVVSTVTYTGQSATPFGVALDAQDNIYIGIIGGTSAILKLSATGVLISSEGGVQEGFADGTGTAAEFNGLAGVAVDSQDNIYVADAQNQRIRFVTPGGVVTTIAGSSSAGFADGNGNTALFNSPFGVAIDAKGNIYIADQNNNRIRMITVE